MRKIWSGTWFRLKPASNHLHKTWKDASGFQNDPPDQQKATMPCQIGLFLSQGAIEIGQIWKQIPPNSPSETVLLDLVMLFVLILIKLSDEKII